MFFIIQLKNDSKWANTEGILKEQLIDHLDMVVSSGENGDICRKHISSKAWHMLLLRCLQS